VASVRNSAKIATHNQLVDSGDHCGYIVKELKLIKESVMNIIKTYRVNILCYGESMMQAGCMCCISGHDKHTAKLFYEMINELGRDFPAVDLNEVEASLKERAILLRFLAVGDIPNEYVLIDYFDKTKLGSY